MIRCHIHDNHNPAVMVIADDLVRIWCHDICNHHNGTYQYRKIMHTLSLDTYVILWKYIIIFFYYGIRCKSILIRMLGFYLSGPSHDCICPLQWRYYGRDLVSNHRRLDCLLNRLLRRRWQKTLKLRVPALCGGIHRWPLNYHHKGPVTRKMFPFDDIIMRSGLGYSQAISWCAYCMSRMRAHPPSMCNQSGHAIVPRQNYATWFGHGQKGCSGIKWWNVSFFKSAFSRIFLYTVALNTWDWLPWRINTTFFQLPPCQLHTFVMRRRFDVIITRLLRFVFACLQLRHTSVMAIHITGHLRICLTLSSSKLQRKLNVRIPILL